MPEEVVSERTARMRDGGMKAWLIVISSFITNGVIFGIHNCFGILYVWFRDEFTAHGIEEASAKASLVGSLAIGMTFLTSPIAGILIDKFGARSTALLGGILAATGMLLSAYSLDRVEVLYFTYGVMFGAGSSLTYNPSLVVLGHHFNRRLGLVNGLVTSGSSIFTVCLPFALESLLQNVGLVVTLQVLSGSIAFLILCSIFYEVPELETKVLPEKNEVFNKEIWKNRKYIIWIVGVPLALTGYFVPYVHLVAFAKRVTPESDGKWLVLCIGLTSGIGRLIFGKIADLPKTNRLFIQQCAIFFIGVLTMLLTTCSEFYMFVLICLGLGLADGCFVTLQGIIAFDICGQKGASQALGFMLGIIAIPVTIGPPIAGALCERLGSYVVPFILAGIPPVLGAIFVCFAQRMVPADVTEAFVGSMAIGMTFLMSPIAGVLIDFVGARKTALLGGMMAVTGMVSSAYALHQVEILYFTYGFLFGGGASLVYSPALVVLGHYFDKYLGLVNGILATGSSVATVVLPFVLSAFFDSVGLAATFQITAGILFTLVLCSYFYNIPKSNEVKPVFNREVWKNKKYVVWVIGVPFSMLGYFVPYTHLVSFSKQVAPNSDARWLMTCIGLTSGIGRLVFGKVADIPKVNRLMLQQIAIASMGISMMLMSCATSFTWLIVTSLALGLFDGCFVTLVGIIGFDICGPAGVSQGIGFLLGMKAIPVMAGPPIAGHIYSAFGNSYVIAFLLAGIPSLIGAVIITFAHFKQDVSVDLEQSKPGHYDNLGLDLSNDTMKPSNDLPVILKSAVMRTFSTASIFAHPKLKSSKSVHVKLS